MTDTINFELLGLTGASTVTPVFEDVIIVVGSNPAAAGNSRMIGALTDAGWGLAWPEGTEQEAFEAPELADLLPRGFVFENIHFSQESVVSRWLPRQSKTSYNVRAFVTAGTINVPDVFSRSAGNFAGLQCRSVFQRAGFVDITLPMRTRRWFGVNTDLKAGSIRYSSWLSDPSESGIDPILIAGSASTEPDSGDFKLEGKILDLVSGASGVRFEEGMESMFARDLKVLLEQHGKSAVTTLSKALATAETNVTAEALRTLTRFEDLTSLDQRRWLLEANLTAKSPLLRDVALSALAELGDARSIPALRRALAQERIDALRTDMDELVRQLDRRQSPR